MRPTGVRDRLLGSRHPADAPPDHAVFFREGADDEGALGHALQRQRVDERPSVEEEALHGGVVDEEEVLLAAEVADDPPVLLVEVAARGHRGAHEQETGRRRADDLREGVAVEAPAVVLGHEGDKARRPACEADAVDDARVGRVGDDDLVVLVHEREHRVQEPLHTSGGDDDLANRVVAVAGPLGREVGDGRAEIEVAGEGKPAVGLGRVEAGDRLGNGLGRQREVGVEVLHPQDGAPARVGRGGDLVDAKAPDRLDALGSPHGGSRECTPVCCPRESRDRRPVFVVVLGRRAGARRPPGPRSRSLGVDVKLIVGHDPPGRLTKLLHPKEGRHTPPPDYVLPVGRSVIVPANASLPNIVSSPPAMLRMKRIFAEEQFDVVHVHEPLAPILSPFALIVADCPAVATVHAAGERLGWYPMGNRLWGIAADRADLFIAVSEAACRSAEPYLGGPFEVIPNGIVLPMRSGCREPRWQCRLHRAKRTAEGPAGSPALVATCG